jgi:hypothetical protein
MKKFTLTFNERLHLASALRMYLNVIEDRKDPDTLPSEVQKMEELWNRLCKSLDYRSGYDSLDSRKK